MRASSGKRRPLVLVPGLLCDSLLWQRSIADLGDVADAWVADHTRSSTMQAIAADILNDAPFQHFALAGLSMGGYIAMEIMRQAPQRVTSLALLDTTARADSPEQSERRLELIEMATKGRFIGVTDALLPLFVHGARLSDTGLVGTIRTMARNVGRDAFVRQERAILGRADSRPLLKDIRCPTLVLCGREDALTPLDRHEEMAGLLPAAELVVIERCGHLTTLERPDETGEAMRHWLGRSI